jgi:hypothetical protein
VSAAVNLASHHVAGSLWKWRELSRAMPLCVGEFGKGLWLRCGSPRARSDPRGTAQVSLGKQRPGDEQAPSMAGGAVHRRKTQPNSGLGKAIMYLLLEGALCFCGKRRRQSLPAPPVIGLEFESNDGWPAPDHQHLGLSDLPTDCLGFAGTVQRHTVDVFTRPADVVHPFLTKRANWRVISLSVRQFPRTGTIRIGTPDILRVRGAQVRTR